MWVCRSCNTNNSDNANYCSNCGQKKPQMNENVPQNEKKTSIKATRNSIKRMNQAKNPHLEDR